MDVPQNIEPLWRGFLESHPELVDANERFYESFRIGDADEVADEGARLIVSGEKTATSSPLWDYEDSDKPLPYVDALSVVENGRRKPVCVVRTTWVEVVPFGEVDAEFAYEYGEADGTLEGWRKMIREYYSEDRVARGRKISEDTPMVCERFEVVFP